MSAAARQARSALASIRREGEQVTLHRATGGTLSVPCLITARAEPIMSNGRMRFNEDHSLGRIPASLLTTQPMQGDRITTAAQDIYRIDSTPDAEDGLWLMILRRDPLPEGVGRPAPLLGGVVGTAHVTEPPEEE